MDCVQKAARFFQSHGRDVERLFQQMANEADLTGDQFNAVRPYAFYHRAELAHAARLRGALIQFSRNHVSQIQGWACPFSWQQPLSG